MGARQRRAQTEVPRPYLICSLFKEYKTRLRQMQSGQER